MQPKNDEGIVVDAERFEILNIKLEKGASKSHAFDENDFSQSNDVNTIRIKKEALDPVFKNENGFLETKMEIDEHDLYHNATYLFDTETFYYTEINNNVKKDLDTTSKSVISAKELKNFFNGAVEQNIKKALTVSSDCDGDNGESIDLKPAVESNINSRNVYENDTLSEAFVNSVNKPDLNEIFSKENPKELKGILELQLKGAVLLNKTEISNFNSKNVAERCTLKKRSVELLGTTEDLYVHLYQHDLYELQSQNNEAEKSTCHHRKNVGRPKIFHCSVCPFKATIKFQLAVHIIENHKDLAKAKNLVEVQYMMPGSSPDEVLFKCNKCFMVSKSKYSLQQHLLTHKSVDECEQTFRCASCTYVAKNRKNIVSHVMVHIPAERQHIHKCPYCDYRTKYKNYIRRHIRSMHNPEKKTPNRAMYKCDHCPFSTKYKDSIINHRTKRMEMSKEDMIPCSLCPHKGKSILTQHMFMHKTPDEVVMYKCDLCSFFTRRKGNLIQHQTVHEEDVISCSLCSYKAKNQWALSSHMSIHLYPSQITMYKCDQCTRHFRRRSHMSSHILTHMNKDERPLYQCDHCEYKATVKHYLRTHYKLMHMDPSKIDWKRCDKCEFKTKTSCNLRKHFLVHKKPEELEMFRCAHCPYSTKRKGQLKTHIEKHMNVYYNCPMCRFKTVHRLSFNRHKKKVHQWKSQVYRSV